MTDGHDDPAHKHHGDVHHHDENHGHGHHHDAGLKGFLRYLRFAPRMWSSPVSTALVDRLGPGPGDVVLDLGAGYGPASVLSLERGADVVAVDPTMSMRLVLTARRLLQGRRSQLAVRNGAAEALPAEDASVDAVISCNTMHHWSSTASGVQEIRRVLKPGGRTMLADELFNDPDHSEFETTGKNFDESGHHHGMTMVNGEEMRDLMVEAGLVNCTAERVILAGEPVLLVTGNAPSD